MTTTKTMLARSEEIARENSSVTQKRTQYVVRLNSGLYARQGVNDHQWTQDVYDARRFDFMIVALAYATLTLELDLDTYSVVTV